MRSHRLLIVLTAINLVLLLFLLSQTRLHIGTGGVRVWTNMQGSVIRGRSLEIVDGEGRVRKHRGASGRSERAIRRHRNPAAGRRERAPRREACHHRTRRRARSRKRIRRQLCATVWARTRRDEGRATAADSVARIRQAISAAAAESRPQAVPIVRPDQAAVTSATTISSAATAKVIRMPAATASGRAVVMSLVADASANTAPMTDAPVMSPRLRDRLSMPEMTPRRSGRDVRHDGRVVRGLEQRIADRGDHDRGDVARDAERRRHHRQKEAAGRHSDQPDDGHAACAETVGQAAGRHAGQRGDERTDRQDEPDKGRVEPERARRDRTARPPASPSSPSRRARSWRGSRSARGSRNIANRISGDAARRLGEHEQAGADDRRQQQSHVERPNRPRPIVMASA